MDKSKEYTNNISSVVYSLNKMNNDIRRVLSGESNHKLSLQEKENNKMTNAKYKVLCIRAHAHEIKDAFGIYNKWENNTLIINEIEKLYKNNNKTELIVLKDIVQESLKTQEFENYRKSFDKTIALKDTELYSYSKDIQELKK